MSKIIFFLIAFFVGCNAVVRAQSGEDLHLDERLAERYDQAMGAFLSPDNLPLADSLIEIGQEGANVGPYLAGLWLKSYPLFAMGEFQQVDSLYDIVISHSRQFCPKLFFRAYYMKVHVGVMQNDFHGMLRAAQEMGNAAQEDQDVNGIVSSYISLGIVFSVRSNPKLSEQYFEMARSLAVENDMASHLSTIYVYLANLCSVQDKADEAAHYVSLAIHEAKSVGNELNVRQMELQALWWASLSTLPKSS